MLSSFHSINSLASGTGASVSVALHFLQDGLLTPPNTQIQTCAHVHHQFPLACSSYLVSLPCFSSTEGGSRSPSEDHLIIPDVCQTIEVVTENEEQAVSSSHSYPLQISPMSSYGGFTLFFFVSLCLCYSLLLEHSSKLWKVLRNQKLI